MFFQVICVLPPSINVRIVLKIFFNGKGIAKIDLGLGRGKKDRDKRADEKRKDWQRQKQRLLRIKN